LGDLQNKELQQGRNVLEYSQTALPRNPRRKVAGGGFRNLLVMPYIEVILPAQYLESEIAFAVLDHEFEHLITAAYFEYWSKQGTLKVPFDNMKCTSLNILFHIS